MPTNQSGTQQQAVDTQAAMAKMLPFLKLLFEDPSASGSVKPDGSWSMNYKPVAQPGQPSPSQQVGQALQAAAQSGVPNVEGIFDPNVLNQISQGQQWAGKYASMIPGLVNDMAYRNALADRARNWRQQEMADLVKALGSQMIASEGAMQRRLAADRAAMERRKTPPGQAPMTPLEEDLIRAKIGATEALADERSAPEKFSVAELTLPAKAVREFLNVQQDDEGKWTFQPISRDYMEALDDIFARYDKEIAEIKLPKIVKDLGIDTGPAYIYTLVPKGFGTVTPEAVYEELLMRGLDKNEAAQTVKAWKESQQR